jgi:hypothetical protein
LPYSDSIKKGGGFALKKIGFIDHYLHEWHADNFPKWIAELSGGAMKVCYAWAEIDSPNEGGKTNADWCKEMDVELCGSIGELIGKSDLLIVLSPDNPERHEDLCRLPLESGKLTYIDKTFAYGLDAAKNIAAHAQKHGAVCYSCSSRIYAAELLSRKGADIELINSRGPGELTNYAVHQVEPIFCLMGMAERVIAFGDAGRPTLVYEFPGKRQAVVSFFDYNVGFAATFRYKDGRCEEEPFASDSFKPFIESLVRFFETGEPPVAMKDTLAVMSMIDAARKAAANPGVWTNIEAV